MTDLEIVSEAAKRVGSHSKLLGADVAAAFRLFLNEIAIISVCDDISPPTKEEVD